MKLPSLERSRATVAARSLFRSVVGPEACIESIGIMTFESRRYCRRAMNLSSYTVFVWLKASCFLIRVFEATRRHARSIRSGNALFSTTPKRSKIQG